MTWAFKGRRVPGTDSSKAAHRSPEFRKEWSHLGDLAKEIEPCLYDVVHIETASMARASPFAATNDLRAASPRFSRERLCCRRVNRAPPGRSRRVPPERLAISARPPATHVRTLGTWPGAIPLGCGERERPLAGPSITTARRNAVGDPMGPVAIPDSLHRHTAAERYRRDMPRPRPAAEPPRQAFEQLPFH
jgi:hypothetical protein